MRYDVHEDGRKIREFWVTDWDNVEGGRDVVDTLESMADFFREMLDAIQNAGGGPGSAIVDDHVFAHLKELGGFPVVTSDFDEHGHPDHLSNTIQEEQPIAISA